MDIKEYIASGILELYVLGQLSPEEAKAVEAMQSQHSLVAQEIYEISRSLEQYSQVSSMTPPPALEDKILSQLPPKSVMPSVSDSSNPSGGKLNIITSVLAIGALSLLGLLLYNNSNHKEEINSYDQRLKVCDSITTSMNTEMAMAKGLNDPANKIVKLSPSAAYAGIDLYLHSNPATKRNILQIIKAPTIASNQSLQLWALKDGQDPQPLEVFSDAKDFVEVSFVDDTKTYAITIEPAGGSKSPTLANMIGTIGVE